MTLDRRTMVMLLLESRDDYLPSLRVATPRGAAGGAAPSGWVPCDACQGVGRTVGSGEKVQVCQTCKTWKPKRPRHGCHQCPVCEGKKERRRRASDPGWDSMTGMASAELDTITRSERELAQGKRAKRELALTITPQEEKGFRWEQEKDRYWRAGSYQALGICLAWLKKDHWMLYESIGFYEMAQNKHMPWVLDPRTEAQFERAVDLLCERMPDDMRVPWWIEARHEEKEAERQRISA